MAEFLHERRDFDQLLAVVANDRGLDPMLAEKDYPRFSNNCDPNRASEIQLRTTHPEPFFSLAVIR